MGMDVKVRPLFVPMFVHLDDLVLSGKETSGMWCIPESLRPNFS